MLSTAEHQQKVSFKSQRDRISQIIAEEAEKHRLTFDEVVCGRRKHVVIVRQKAMWRARHELELSLSAIGKAFQVDHTTVNYAVRKIDAMHGKASSPRVEAFHNGAETYLGPPCARGHDGKRRTTSAKCIHCERERNRVEYAKKKEQMVAVDTPEPEPVEKLTQRQQQAVERDQKIIKFLGQGLAPCDIGERAGLSISTVNDRIAALRKIRDDIPSVEVLRMRSRFR